MQTKAKAFLMSSFRSVTDSLFLPWRLTSSETLRRSSEGINAQRMVSGRWTRAI